MTELICKPGYLRALNLDRQRNETPAIAAMIVSGVAEPSIISLPPESHQVQSRVSMDNPIQVDLGRIAQDLQIRRVQVESVVQLLDEGNTVPFITRYRKERTGNLNEVTIREIQLRVQRLRELADRCSGPQQPDRR